MKVNQRKEIIEEIVKSGRKFNIGLEVGTKAELLAALSFDLSNDALLICNGFKDNEYLHLALNAIKLNNKVVIVIDEFSETRRLLDIAKQLNVKPIIGIRAKLYSRGAANGQNQVESRQNLGFRPRKSLRALK